MIVATAGHIDHGKSALVRALTGVDTDRLPEEQRRGISIELGFAPLVLPRLGAVSIVDVPGHAAFVRTMITGAMGVDAALLVVAANEGVMPQTVEHLRVLRALAIPVAVVAVTKCDLATDVDLELVRAALHEHDSLLPADVPTVRVAPTSGEGLDALRGALAEALGRVSPRGANDEFRLVADRAFSVNGVGTVVTGSVWHGSLDVGEHVVILPSGGRSRVRAIQTHGTDVPRATAGERVALVLADVTPAAVPRESALVRQRELWPLTRRIAVCADELDRPGILSAKRSYIVHVGGGEAVGRVARLELQRSGDGRLASIALDRPVVTRYGDRVILRERDPLDTVAGGWVCDPLVPQRSWPVALHGPDAQIASLLERAGTRGITAAELCNRAGVAPAAVAQRVGRSGFELAGRWFGCAAREVAEQQLMAAAASEWRRAPLAGGATRAQLRSATAAAPPLAEQALDSLLARGALIERDGRLRPAAGAELDDAAAERIGRVVERIERSGLQPPSVPELRGEFGDDVGALVRYAAREGNLVEVERVRYYGAGVIAELVRRLREAMLPGRVYSPAELRGVLGVSRKYLVPLLEYCDGIGVTERRSGGRVVAAVSSQRES